MRRLILGAVVMVHGLAHANFAIYAAHSGPAWLVQALWALALLGYLSAGLGMLRVPVIRDRWKPLLIVGTVSSMMLLFLMRDLLGSLGIVIDVLLLVLVMEWAQPRVDADVNVACAVGADGLGHSTLHRVAWGVGSAMLLWVTVVVVTRPVTMHWGTTTQERMANLPGDELTDAPRYRIDHGITIAAPADSVWPWLVQLGQDRGGFYSYAWLERLAGDHITNATRVHPEWQGIEAGQLVRATQRDYAGGRLGELGWHVVRVEPGRALVLENWGAFVVQPIDAQTSRLLIRTRGPGTPSFAGIALGPLNVFVFEPAHFIMQRGMMRGIRARAEAMVAQPMRTGARS
ncbi:MAG: hypothetical protein ABIY52_11760 [Gemmatimonadaceae bacterium]